MQTSVYKVGGTAPIESRVIEVVKDRTEVAAEELWKTLSEEQRDGLEAVSIDMSQAFENSIQQNAPNAEIVFDKFHIAKHLNEGVDKVRRAEHKELKAVGDKRLTGSRQLWLFSPENIHESRQAEFETLRKQQLKTSRAWGFKDYFRWFWMSGDSTAAREFFDDWYAWTMRSRLKPMKQVARMLKKRLEGLLSWFRHPISNGPAEGFNSRIQSIKSAARGFRNFKNYRTRILFYCGKLELKPEIQ